MIVDCHSHVFAYPGHLSGEFVREANSRAHCGNRADLHVPPERHWRAMQGVDKVIAFGLRAYHLGVCTPNEYVAGYADRFPDKVIGFATVDPSQDKTRETLEHAIGKLRLRGVKLGPIYQNLHPTDRRLMEVYEFCEAHRLPIMIHQETTFPRRAPLKYSLPILLEECPW